MRAANGLCERLGDKAFRAYATGDDGAFVGLGLTRWKIATHFRECAACAVRYNRFCEDRRDLNPWTGAEPVGLVSRRRKRHKAFA
jgi:hypothetical protein